MSLKNLTSSNKLMVKFITDYIIKPTLDRFIVHLCQVYNKQPITHDILYNVDPNTLRILSLYPKLHMEEGNVFMTDELVPDSIPKSSISME